MSLKQDTPIQKHKNRTLQFKHILLIIAIVILCVLTFYSVVMNIINWKPRRITKVKQGTKPAGWESSEAERQNPFMGRITKDRENQSLKTDRKIAQNLITNRRITSGREQHETTRTNTIINNIGKRDKNW